VIEVRGWQRVANELRRLAVDMPDMSAQVMADFGQHTRRTLKGTRYPPPPPNSTYVRTGRLASSWSADVSGIKAIIRNTARNPRGGRPYAIYVVGDAKGEGQASIHSGRWWRGRDIVEREVKAELTPKLTKAIQARMNLI
jgi:hypothetical protein